MLQTTQGVTAPVLNSLPSGVDDGGAVPSRNRLLASLGMAAFAKLRPHVESVRLEKGDILFEPQQPLTHVYFPERAGVLLLDIDRLQTSVAGTVGCEGMVGVGLFAGEVRTSLLATTYLPGMARRVPADAFRELAAISGPIHQLMLTYAHAFLTQVIAEHRCNKAHSVVQRSARWLVLTSRRADNAEFPLDVEVLALVIGAQRAGASLGVRTLEERGLIEYRAGLVNILDQRALEEAACDCRSTISEP